MRLPPLLVLALLPTISLPALGETLLAFRDSQGVLHLSNRPDGAGIAASMLRGQPQQDARPFGTLIESTAIRFGLDPALLHALIRVESGYDPQARSPKGALGLMQLMPDTARRFGAMAPLDPADNLAAGSRYLSWLLDRFGGELPLALAAYNAGEGAVARFGDRIPPFPETNRYVAKVLRHYRSGNAAAVAGQRQVPVLRDFAPLLTERW